MDLHRVNRSTFQNPIGKAGNSHRKETTYQFGRNLARAIIGSGWELNELHGVSLSLENIFLELTSKQEAA